MRQRQIDRDKVRGGERKRERESGEGVRENDFNMSVADSLIWFLVEL